MGGEVVDAAGNSAMSGWRRRARECDRTAWIVACRGLAMVLIAVLLPAACTPPTEQAAVTEQHASGKIVVTEIARRATLHDSLVLSAEVAPWAAVTVTSQTTGQVVHVDVEVSDLVAADDVVARLEDIQARALMTQADARLEQARAAQRQALLDLERGERLAASRDISRGELDRLILARDTTVAQTREAEAALLLATKRLSDTVITAPFAGVVADRFIEVGSWVGVGAPVVRVVDEARLKVRAAASQAERTRLKTGLPVLIAAHALPQERFEGRIRLLGAESDAVTGSYLVEAAVEQPVAASGTRLLPGMQATMTVLIDSFEALVVPRSAVVQEEEGERIFVVRGDRARAVKPVLGRATSEQVEVVEGVTEGDVVIVQGQHLLSDGDPVEAHGR